MTRRPLVREVRFQGERRQLNRNWRRRSIEHARGRRHFHLRPTDDRARLDLENQILTALGCREEAS